MKLQARNFVVRKPETIDISMFFKKFCIATRTRDALEAKIRKIRDNSEEGMAVRSLFAVISYFLLGTHNWACVF